jgi:hypothetical protein
MRSFYFMWLELVDHTNMKKVKVKVKVKRTSIFVE